MRFSRQRLMFSWLFPSQIHDEKMLRQSFTQALKTQCFSFSLLSVSENAKAIDL